jgi:hypothetical protein
VSVAAGGSAGAAGGEVGTPKHHSTNSKDSTGSGSSGNSTNSNSLGGSQKGPSSGASTGGGHSTGGSSTGGSGSSTGENKRGSVVTGDLFVKPPPDKEKPKPKPPAEDAPYAPATEHTRTFPSRKQLRYARRTAQSMEPVASSLDPAAV